MKILLFAALFLLLVTNVAWYCEFYDLQANYDQESGLRNESDNLLRQCQAGIINK